MNYTKPTQLLVRYDASLDKVMIGGGAAETFQGIFGTPTKSNFSGWGNITPGERTAQERGRYVSEASYDGITGINQNIRALEARVATLNRQIDSESQGEDSPDLYDVVIKYSFELSRPLVDAFFENALGIARGYSSRLDSLATRLSDYQRGEDKETSEASKILAEFNAIGQELADRKTALPKFEGYVCCLIPISFRMEYQGISGESIGINEVSHTYRDKEREYRELSEAIPKRLAELKASDGYRLLTANSQVEQEDDDETEDETTTEDMIPIPEKKDGKYLFLF
jgi:hypothetical protein